MRTPLSLTSVAALLALPFTVTRVAAQDFTSNATSLTGTWSTGSGAVVTGPGFADPFNFDRPFIYPANTGISYSFTDDGYFEEAQYRFNANASDPRCATAVVMFQHGKYYFHSNGSLTLDPAPFAADGRIQIQDPCAAQTEVLTYYNQFTLFNGWTITIDTHHAAYYLQLYRFDGSLFPRLFLTVRPPTMLPTVSLDSIYNGSMNADGTSNTTPSQRAARVPNADASDVVYNAIKAGYRLFDGAADYGNEKECGEGVARAIKEGLVKREDLFIVSKLWNTNHKYENVKPACELGLKLWGIDYFDLYLIHFPVALEYVNPDERYPPAWWDASGPGGKVTIANDPMHGTWKGMEELKEAGLAKSIGISNCSGGVICDLLRYAKHQPEVLQIEHHPYLTQEPLVKYCKDIGLAITAYSSFGPQSFLELEHAGAMDTPSLLEHPVINEIAKAHGKTPAQVLLRWSTQRGIMTIPKSNNPERAQQNLNHTEFDLTEEDLKKISGLNKNLRFNNPQDIDPRLAIFA